MLQQSELIFDFASDHVNMSQVSECYTVMNVLVRVATELALQHMILCNLTNWNLICFSFVCAAVGGLLGLPCGDCGAGSSFTSAFISRSSF